MKKISWRRWNTTYLYHICELFMFIWLSLLGHFAVIGDFLFSLFLSLVLLCNMNFVSGRLFARVIHSRISLVYLCCRWPCRVLASPIAKVWSGRTLCVGGRPPQMCVFQGWIGAWAGAGRWCLPYCQTSRPLRSLKLKSESVLRILGPFGLGWNLNHRLWTGPFSIWFVTVGRYYRRSLFRGRSPILTVIMDSRKSRRTRLAFCALSSLDACSDFVKWHWSHPVCSQGSRRQLLLRTLFH